MYRCSVFFFPLYSLSLCVLDENRMLAQQAGAVVNRPAPTNWFDPRLSDPKEIEAILTIHQEK
jgi:hypothetical protein